MSLKGVAMGVPLYAYDPLVCRWGIADHPHYFDCKNCPHNIWCEDGILRMGMLSLIEQQDAINAKVDEYNANIPGLNMKHLEVIPDEWRYYG